MNYRISKKTGQKDNLAALVCWLIMTAVYYCIFSLLLRGYVLGSFISLEDSVMQDLGTIGIIVVIVIAALLTVRPAFRLYLRMKAYRAQKGPGWQDWKERTGGKKK